MLLRLNQQSFGVTNNHAGNSSAKNRPDYGKQRFAYVLRVWNKLISLIAFVNSVQSDEVITG